jgi:hypothetical protein
VLLRFRIGGTFSQTPQRQSAAPTRWVTNTDIWGASMFSEDLSRVCFCIFV